MSTLVMISGGFDCCHAGHIELIERASKFGDICCILNTDEWLTRKKGKPFMCLEERMKIMSSLRLVRYVEPQVGKDDSVCKTIEYITKTYSKSFPAKGIHHPYSSFLFANGGDRAKLNTPEVDTCISLGVGLVWGLGDKIQSSSELIKNAQPKFEIKPSPLSPEEMEPLDD